MSTRGITRRMNAVGSAVTRRPGSSRKNCLTKSQRSCICGAFVLAESTPGSPRRSRRAVQRKSSVPTSQIICSELIYLMNTKRRVPMIPLSIRARNSKIRFLPPAFRKTPWTLELEADMSAECILSFDLDK